MVDTRPFLRLPDAATTRPSRFTVEFPEQELKVLKALISTAKIGPVTYENSLLDRRLGLSRQWLLQATTAWRAFDWREVERELNEFPNYTMPITNDEIDFTIHFVALFSDRNDAVPIVMLHGWPGSVLEFLPILRLLKERYTSASLPYHVVVPSLPGYTFSSPPPVDKDFRLENCAQIIDDLMVKLGFRDGFVVQGGDVGSKVARVLSVHPRAKAIHLNFGIMPDPGIAANPETAYNKHEKQGLERKQWFERVGAAYAIEQATRPSTLSFVLSSNPIALLAWIGEKFLDWTDDDLPMSVILAEVTLYWLSGCISTSLWPYRQLFTPGNIGAHEDPKWYIAKPFGFSWFPKEIAPVPRRWIETTGNLVFFRQHDKGGHFAALENPETLLKDVEDFVAQVWVTVKSISCA